MKTAKDPRHQRRVKLIQNLFAWQFRQGKIVDPKVQEIISHLHEIDKLITESAPDRPIDQINRVDLSILRLAVFELIIDKGVPPKVVVDEAVELGKEYGSDSSPSFINGALGKLIAIKKIAT